MNALRTVPWDRVAVRGAVGVETVEGGRRPHRLPRWAHPQIPDAFLRQTFAEAAGIRLALRTAATTIELDVHARRMMPDATTPMPPSVYDLTAGGRLLARATAAAGSRYLFTFEEPAGTVVPGPVTTVRFTGLPARDTDEVELWLPFTDAVDLRDVRTDAEVLPPVDPTGPARVRWVHHGSSISHGYSADAPTAAWPVVAALQTGVTLTNMAYSGNAVLDPFTARAIRDQPADLISLKIGINLVNGDLMRMRTFRTAVDGFLDTIRDGHPHTPIVLCSPVCCPPVEESAGPTMQDPSRSDPWSIAAGTRDDVALGHLSLQSIRAALAQIVQRRQSEDPALTYLDGLRLYGGDDAVRVPLPDNLHPSRAGQRLIGDRFADIVLRPFLAGSGAVG